DPSGSTRMFYDNMGRVTEQARTIAGRLYNVWNTYDLAGRPATLTYPDGETVSYGYDTGGRLTRAGSYVDQGAYNVRGQLTSRAACNGVVETFSYSNTRNWLTSRATSIVPAALALTYNERGDITTLNGPLTLWTYMPDALGRIISTSGPYAQSFSYDLNGRM